jgi:hypothetical protein
MGGRRDATDRARGRCRLRRGLLLSINYLVNRTVEDEFEMVKCCLSAMSR